MNNTPTRVPLKTAHGHVPRFRPVLRCAVALGALLGISVSVFTVSGRASATLSSPTTAAFIDSEPGDPLLNGGAITFSSMLYQGGGGAPRFTLFNGSGSPWQIYFAPPTTDAALVPGTYEDAQFSADAAHPELSIVGGPVNSCTFGTGRFIVDDITTSAGVLQTFSARFEEHDCNGGPALFGAISYNSTADYRTRTVSPNSPSLATSGNTSTTGDVTITDNGPSALTPSGFTISGADAGQFRDHQQYLHESARRHKQLCRGRHLCARDDSEPGVGDAQLLRRAVSSGFSRRAGHQRYGTRYSADRNRYSAARRVNKQSRLR